MVKNKQSIKRSMVFQIALKGGRNANFAWGTWWFNASVMLKLIYVYIKAEVKKKI